MKKLALIASVILALEASFAPPVLALQRKFPPPRRGKLVDCGKVMKELRSGKKAEGIARELGISRYSVDHCRQVAREKMLQKRGQETEVPGAVSGPTR